MQMSKVLEIRRRCGQACVVEHSNDGTRGTTTGVRLNGLVCLVGGVDKSGS